MTQNPVMTVLGPIPPERLGVTLMHEHIVLDASSWWHCPSCAERMRLAERKLASGHARRTAYGPVRQQR